MHGLYRIPVIMSHGLGFDLACDADLRIDIRLRDQNIDAGGYFQGDGDVSLSFHLLLRYAKILDERTAGAVSCGNEAGCEGSGEGRSHGDLHLHVNIQRDFSHAPHTQLAQGYLAGAVLVEFHLRCDGPAAAERDGNIPVRKGMGQRQAGELHLDVGAVRESHGDGEIAVLVFNGVCDLKRR